MTLDLAEAPVRSEPSNRDRGMVRIAGGTFRMGSDLHYAEEAPVHCVTVDGFWVDRAPITNAEFRRFVDETRHVTFAEITPGNQRGKSSLDAVGSVPRFDRRGAHRAQGTA